MQRFDYKGILADDKNKFKQSGLHLTYLGKIKDYEIKEEDYFLIAFGKHPAKYEIYTYLSKQGAKFYTFIHPSSIVSSSAVLGEGVVIMPFCVIGEEAILENNIFINKFSNVGHGSVIKESSILSPYTMIGGSSVIGKNNFFGSQSIVAPNTKIGDNCVISANTFVRKNIKSKTLVFNSSKEIKCAVL